MNLSMLPFIICGLLTSVTKAGWLHQRCWKNDIGHCRSRCFHTERYKLLCMNKLNCCTPIKLEEYTQRPLPPLLPTDDNDYFTWGASPNAPGTGPNDEIPISTVDTLMTETIAFKKKVSTPPMTHLLQSRTSPSGYEASEIMIGNIIQGAKSTDVSPGTVLWYLLPTADDDYFTWGASSSAPGTGPNDEIPISTVDTLMTETTTFKKKVFAPPMTHLLQSRTSPSGYEGAEITTGNIIQGAKSTDVVSSGTFLRYLLFHRGLDDMKTDIMLLPRKEPRELPYN